MHGIMHEQLRRYYEHVQGEGAWESLLAQAGFQDRTYTASEPYPDEDTTALVKAAASRTGLHAEKFLESYGEFIAPTLMRMYGNLIDPSWRTMDLFLNTEDAIHQAVRARKPGALPPKLRFEKIAPDTLLFRYDSPRRMSAVAKGIMRGVAKHYREPIRIEERRLAGNAVEMTVTIG